MSLVVYERLEQGTDEWLEARRGIITASVVGKLVTPTGKVADNQTSRSLVQELVAERITGRVEEPVWSRDIERGHLDEPYARAAYAEAAGVTVNEIGFMTREFEGHLLGYSPDGLVGADGLIEIKSRKPRLQVHYVLSGEIPHDHMAQIQAGLLVSGRKWCDYVSYSGGMHLAIRRVFPEAHWRDSILAALRAFEEYAAYLLDDYMLKTRRMPMTEFIDHFEEIEIGF